LGPKFGTAPLPGAFAAKAGHSAIQAPAAPAKILFAFVQARELPGDAGLDMQHFLTRQ
jgi:hypothetical protein